MTPSPVIASLRRSIAAQHPVDARHAASIQQFLADLDRLPAPLDERADPTHVTASAIVVGAQGTLLHKHKRLGLWMQPGGHIEPGEVPEEAAVREVREETGLRTAHPADGPRLIHVDVHPAGPHVHLDLRYLLDGGDQEPSPPPGESQDVRWFPWDEALAVADVALVGALRAIKPRALPPSAA